MKETLRAQFEWLRVLLFHIVALTLVTLWPALAHAHPVRIGVAAPLSGSSSWLGESTRQGIELYLTEHPDFARRTEFIYEDVGSGTATAGVSAVRNLIEARGIAGLIIEHSTVTNAAAPFIDQSRIPTIAITGSDSARGRSFMVKLWFPLQAEAQAAKEYLIKEKLTRLVSVTTEQDSMLDRTRTLKEALGAQLPFLGELTVSAVEEVPAVAAKIPSLKPQVVVLHLMPGQCGLMARKLRELGYTGLFISTVAAADASERTLAQGALRGALAPSFVPNPDFTARFMSRFHAEPEGATPNGYDAAKLFDQALAQVAEPRTPEEVVSALKVRNFSGALGTYSFGFTEANTYEIPIILRAIQ